MEAIGTHIPEFDTREGRMLAGGRLVVTVTSKATHRHVTLRLRATRKDGEEWPTVPFDEATHVYVEAYDDAHVATYYPESGLVWWARAATPAAKWTLVNLLRYLAGSSDSLKAVALIDAADECGRCGSELTHPHSIERGFGEVCWGEVARGRPVRALAA